MILKKIKLSTVICGAFIILSAFLLYNSLGLKYWSKQYAPGPGFIPTWASSAMLLLSIIAFVQSFKQEGITLAEALPDNRTGRINLFVCWAGLFFFVFFVNRLGFFITSTILLSSLFSRGVKWSKAIILAVIVVTCCFIIFKIILQVQIPTNKYGW